MNELFNLPQTSMSERIAAYLLNEIFVGTLEQGEHITESKLVKKFDCSHAPVREALYILEARGVVERFPRKGVRVRVLDQKELNDHFDALVGILKLSSENIKEIPADMIIEIEEIFAKIEVGYEVKDIKSYIFNSGNLLVALVALANNSVYERMLQDLLFITNVFAASTWDTETIEQHFAGQKKAVEAIKDDNLKEGLSVLTDTIILSKNG